MHTPLEPEAPVSIVGRKIVTGPGGQHCATVHIVGERGTTCSARTASFRDSTVCAQETFWRATAEGAYQ